MPWWRAWVIGLVVVVYFAATTVWLPSWVIGLLGGSPDGLAGISAVSVWAVFLAAGIVLLGRAQRKGWI